MCNLLKLNGSCYYNDCGCIYGQECAMLNTSCANVCSTIAMNGECDAYGQCICRSHLEVVFPFGCQEQCEQDLSSSQCRLVISDGYIQLGSARVCSCVCVDKVYKHGLHANLNNKNKFNSVAMYKANHTVAVARKFNKWFHDVYKVDNTNYICPLVYHSCNLINDNKTRIFILNIQFLYFYWKFPMLISLQTLFCI